MASAQIIERPTQALNLPSFVVGRVYDRRRDIHEPFGGSRQSGISTSRQVPVIFIFTGGSGERYGYGDTFSEEGVLMYSGEGQRGDMVFNRGNAAIRDHLLDGRALHLFQSLGHGKGQKYLGEFVCQGWERTPASDVDGKIRSAIIFELLPVSLLESRASLLPAASKLEPLEDARSRAIEASRMDGSLGSRVGRRTIYQRSADVRNYVLRRANGVCEGCEQPAPFRRPDGSAYLEPHHTTKMSDGGPDHPRFVAALCPTCHREVHHGEAAAERNSKLQARLLRLEAID
jgi:5-methylcytosine-specific restriction protein A